MTEFQNSKSQTSSLKAELEEKIQLITSQEKDLMQKESNLKEKLDELASLQKAHDALESSTQQIQSLNE